MAKKKCICVLQLLNSVLCSLIIFPRGYMFRDKYVKEQSPEEITSLYHCRDVHKEQHDSSD